MRSSLRLGGAFISGTASEIVSKLRLVDFFMAIRSRLVKSEPTTVSINTENQVS
jgi:hypothetical protein